MKSLDVRPLLILPIVGGLIFSLGWNGIAILIGGQARVDEFLNFTAREARPAGGLTSTLLVIAAVVCVVAAVALLAAVAMRQFLPGRKADMMRWGLWLAAFGVTLMGLPVRLISNHNLAAMIFSYAALIMLILWPVEHRALVTASIFDQLKMMPMVVLLFYTMGQPGFNKIFDSSAVMANYEHMFSGSFLAALPGGVVPFVYILGVMELVAAVLLLASSFGAEFLPSRKKTFLKLSLFVTLTVFVLLSFGLNIINYPGATQLVIYASFTVLLFAYVEYDEKRQLESHGVESPAPAQA